MTLNQYSVDHSVYSSKIICQKKTSVICFSDIRYLIISEKHMTEHFKVKFLGQSKHFPAGGHFPSKRSILLDFELNKLMVRFLFIN